MNLYIRICFLAWISCVFLSADLSALNIAIEGMPGAGKTTSLIQIIEELSEEFILLSETNPEPNHTWQEEDLQDQTQVYHQIWLDRMTTVEQFHKKSNFIFLFDRSYFSNLAFKHAFDFLQNSDFYSGYYRQFEKELKEKEFSLIIVLDVDPDIGYQRRLSVGDPIPFPWSEQKFLKGLRTFYLEELGRITKTPIIYINTDTFTPSETKAKLLQVIVQQTHFDGNARKILNDPQAENLLLKYGKEHHLGQKHSALINVFGYPTLYFLKHSLQFVDGEPLFFNNKRLKEIASKELHTILK